MTVETDMYWHRSVVIRVRFLGGFIIVIIMFIGRTALFEPRSSSEVSASCPYSLQHYLLASSHLSFGLPLCLLPSNTATRTLLVRLCSSKRITCPVHFSRLVLIHITISHSLYNVYNWLLYFILHSPLSFYVGSKIPLKIFLSKTPKIVE